jgi:DisA bacterial checkpoint controller nucleotide-binding
MSGFTVKYFMWSYQPLFQMSAERSAQDLFRKLCPELDISLFLVGIRTIENEARLPVCVEPDHSNVQPSAFNNIVNELQIALDNDDRSNMMYSHPIAAERVHESLQTQSLARAIEKCCALAPSQENRIFMASDPLVIDSYAVSCVISFNRGVYDSCRVFDADVIDRVSVDHSLIQAVAREFLDCCRDALREKDAGVNLCVIKASTEELLRRGGERFVKSIGWRAFGLDSLENAHGLCDAMHAISAMYYEGSTASGRLILSGRDSTTNVADCVHFVNPISIRESRRIRKLLEMTRKHFSLLLMENGVVGVIDANKADFNFSIDIPSHRHWRIFLGNKVICEFQYGIPSLPRPKLESSDFKELCSRILPDNSDITKLWQIAESCIKQLHGTTLVISRRADTESQRLSRQSTLISPRSLSEIEVEALTAIDGALLFDQNGICFACGVILDGLATEEGDPSRGSRYNSALRYLAAHGEDCIILVISEDGEIAVLPKLRPRVSRSELIATIEQLTRIIVQEPFQHRVYAQILQRLDRLRFYFSAEQCDAINRSVDTVENRLDNDGRTVRINRTKFAPNPQMNESHWLD